MLRLNTDRTSGLEISKPNWIPTTPLKNMSQTEYDVLIVGTGAGGGAVLWRLCEQWRNNGKKIGVIEAGGLVLPTNLRNIETMNPARANDLAYNTPGLFIPVSGTRLRQMIALGGRTLAWNAVTPRMYLTAQDWPVPIREMELYYKIAEQAMNVSDSYVNGSPTNQIFLNRLWNSGFAHAMNMPTAIDMQTTKYGELHSNVYFSSISFLARALNRRSYDLAVFSRAVRVLADKGKVEGVEVMTPDKKSYVLKAKKVVLCTSTIETPRLLLYSGIPGHSIGHYLTDHSLVGGPLKINRVLYPYVLGTIGILLPQIAGIPFQVQIEGPTRTQFYHNKEIPFRSEEEIYFNGVGVVQTRYENRITLNPYERDYFGIPKVEFHVSYTAEDINNLDMAEHAVNRAAAALGLGAAHFGRREILAGDHESCTCRMGEDPATSATNRFGQIHGVSGLFVADNSVLPFMEAANPTLTTVALAIRTADYIVRTTV